MSLRQKTLLLISILLVGLIAVLYASLSTIILGSFARLEQQNTRLNVQRLQEALEDELQKLSLTVEDWAAWDDTYTFIQDRNKEFVQANLVDSTFAFLKINFLLLFNNQDKQVFGKGFKLEPLQAMPLPESLQQKLVSNSILLQHPDTSSKIQGILLLKEGSLIVASQPIVTSEGTGPMRGTLIMGRYLNDQKIKELEQRTQLSLKVYRVDNPQLPSEIQAVRSQLENTQVESSGSFAQAPVYIQPLNADVIAGYSLLSDIYGKPALLFQVDIPRDIYKQGQISLHYLLVSLLGVGIVFGAATLLLLEKMVLLRLTNLSTEVRDIGTTNDLSMRVKVKGEDELSSLANTINWMLEKIAKEQEKAENLLLNILPEPIAAQLKQNQKAIAENFDEVTILFADIVGFTPLSARLEPIELVNWLNKIFSTFDNFAEQLGLEKIKTIGDAYMVASGLPVPRADHAEVIAEMALLMQEAVERFQVEQGESFQIRIGINTGVVVAGVIGTRKFIYDLWGDAVNIASRMESSGEPGRIQVTEATYEQLKYKYELQKRGAVSVKGKGEMTTYWLLGKKSSVLETGASRIF